MPHAVKTLNPKGNCLSLDHVLIVCGSELGRGCGTGGGGCGRGLPDFSGVESDVMVEEV